MKRVEFKNEYALHSTANSMLVIAAAGFNIQQAVIYKTCEVTNHSTHLTPQAGIVFSWLPSFPS